MTIHEAYEQIGADYDKAIGFLHTDERLMKYLKKFVQADCDRLIQAALKAQDYDTAFREAHNLKGICANLYITVLGKSASALAESLRKRKPEGDITSLTDAMQKDYNTTMIVIKKLIEEQHAML